LDELLGPGRCCEHNLRHFASGEARHGGAEYLKLSICDRKFYLDEAARQAAVS